MALASLLAMGSSSAVWAGVCKVTPDGTGDGSSWEQATNLHAALADANCTEAQLKQGVYKPVSDAEYAEYVNTGDPRRKYFAVIHPVKIFGGYTGSGDARSTDPLLTIISADIGRPSVTGTLTVDDNGEPRATSTVPNDNADWLMMIGPYVFGGSEGAAAYTPDNMVLDGLTFEKTPYGALVCNGNTDTLAAGAVNQCGLRVNNAVFRNNFMKGHAVLHVQFDENSGPTKLVVTQSQFLNNSRGYTNGGGSAIDFYGFRPEGGSKPPAELLIDNSIFEGNTVGSGSVVGNSGVIDLKLEILNSRFIKNRSGLDRASGAIYVFCPGTVKCTGLIENNYFEGNFAGRPYERTAGAVTWSGGGDLAIVGSTFKNNKLSRYDFAGRRDMGGAISVSNDSANNLSVAIRNSTFDGNRSPVGGAVSAFLKNNDKISIESSTFANNQSQGLGSLSDTNSPNFGGAFLYVSSALNAGESAAVDIKNTIAWGNGGAASKSILMAGNEVQPTLAISNSVLQTACADAAAKFAYSDGWTEPDWEYFFTPLYSDFAPSCGSGIVTGDPTLQPLSVPLKSSTALKAVPSEPAPVPVMLLGPNSSALDTAAAGVATDQRGINRAALGGAAPDIGAVEMRYATLAMAVTGSGQVTGSGTAPATGGVTGCTNADPAQCQAVYYLESATPPQVTLTASPQAGFGLVAWAGACASAGSAATATVSLTEATTCQARFAALASIVATTATAGTGGAVSPADQQVVSGESASYTLAPNAGYEVDTSQVGGTCPAGSWSGNTYTTGPVTQDCAVGFVFKAAGTGPVDPGNPGNPGSVKAVPVPVMESAGLVLLSGLLGAAAAVTNRRRQRKAAK